MTAVLKQRLAGWSKRDEEGREGWKEIKKTSYFNGEKRRLPILRCMHVCCGARACLRAYVHFHARQVLCM